MDPPNSPGSHDSITTIAVLETPRSGGSIADSVTKRPSETTLAFRRFAAECIGSFILIFVGIASVGSAVMTGALTGLWQ
eukprot:jgi/Hompol1/2877/HPOL_006207-RA